MMDYLETIAACGLNIGRYTKLNEYPIYMVTDEALIAQTMVWPNFFLMNVLG